MSTGPAHRCRVVATPWPGVFGTHIESARHYGRHWHATYGLGLLERGAQLSASGRGEVDACAGDVITTNPGEVHDGRPLGGATRRWRMVYLEVDAMRSLLGLRNGGDIEFVRPVIRDPRLAAALRRCFALQDAWSAGAADALACEQSLVAACGLLLARHTVSRPPRDAGGEVARVRERLADELLEPPSLRELAEMAGLSSTQLLRRFQQAYGVPPHAWQVQLRVERARALIGRGMPLAQAAAQCGFADQSHMTRWFTRQFGCTPGAWQRSAAITFKTPLSSRATVDA